MLAAAWLAWRIGRRLSRPTAAVEGALKASPRSRLSAAEEAAAYLNAVLARVGPIVEASGGVIDKHTGDGLLAFWGAPELQPDHADRAIAAAAELRDGTRPARPVTTAADRPPCGSCHRRQCRLSRPHRPHAGRRHREHRRAHPIRPARHRACRRHRHPCERSGLRPAHADRGRCLPGNPLERVHPNKCLARRKDALRCAAT